MYTQWRTVGDTQLLFPFVDQQINSEMQNLISAFNAHIANTSIHFRENTINHTDIQNIGINNHTQIDTFINTKAMPNGITPLDSSGRVSSTYLPPFNVQSVTIVANIPARDALTPSQGDFVKVLNAGGGITKSYYWDGTTWVEIITNSEPIITTTWKSTASTCTFTDSLSNPGIALTLSGSVSSIGPLNFAASGISLSGSSINFAASGSTLGNLNLTNINQSLTVDRFPQYYTFVGDALGPFGTQTGTTTSTAVFLSGYINCNTSTTTLPDRSSLPTGSYQFILYIRNSSAFDLTITPGTSGTITDAIVPRLQTRKYIAYFTPNTYKLFNTQEFFDTGVTTLGGIGSTPNNNAATISGTSLLFEAAGLAFPGILTTGSQSFSGTKTFNSIPVFNLGLKVGKITLLGSSIANTFLLPATLGSSGQYLSQDATWVNPTGGVNIIGSVGSSPNANAATITGSSLSVQPAATGFPGVITTGSQSFSGMKTFTDLFVANTSLTINLVTLQSGVVGSATTLTFPISAPSITNFALSSNGTWIDPGIFALTVVGSLPNQTGASLTTGTLNFQPASLQFPGIISISSQSFNGVKTFNSNPIFTSIGLGNNLTVNTGTVSLTLPSAIPTTGQILVSGSSPNTLDWATVNLTAGGTVELITTVQELSPMVTTSIINSTSSGYGIFPLSNASSNGQIKTIIVSGPAISIQTGTNTYYNVTNLCLVFYNQWLVY